MQNETFESLAATRPRFFLGANAGSGFFSCFGDCYRPGAGERLTILKGGPGTGKSTFMKQLAVWAAEREQPVELYFCSSDPASLDGVRFPTLGAAVIDGTAPHTMDAARLGLTEELVDLGACLNADELQKNRAEILSLYEQNGLLHRRAGRFAAAASRLVDDSFAVDCECCDLERAGETAEKLCDSLLPNKKGGRGAQTRRFLGGLTPVGPLLLEETLRCYADEIVAIEDENGGAASVMMTAIRNRALAAGYEVITCPCALSPERKIDHIIVPDRRLAFCTANAFLPVTVDTRRRIHARRFHDLPALAEKKQRLRFNRRAAEERLDGACTALREAKAVHDLLEKHYIAAMDFAAVDRLRQQLERRLAERLPK